MQTTSPISIDSPHVRAAGRDVLSLALMDARNHSLHLVSQMETAFGGGDLAGQHTAAESPPGSAPISPLLWTLGHIGWFQEWWIARNLQRHRGTAADPLAVRLASIEPQGDVWWNPSAVTHDARWKLVLPPPSAIKSYLLATLESTLDLLEKTPDQDEALYFYRLALCHEDMRGEELIVLAQTLGLPLQLVMPGPVALRDPMLVPAIRWQMGVAGLGSPGSAGLALGFAYDNEQPMFEVPVPEFEIDAQAVTWAQFVEFVDDGGYDRAELWHPAGWQWLQARAADASHDGGRRGPRYVDQIGVASGAVMQTRFGKPMRMLGGQPATHVTWWEADAWCRWAGRRLPAEVEWEVAAHTALRRGWRWGDVWEWTGSTFRGYPGFEAGPWRDYSQPFFGTHKVLRGASFATRARMKHPKFRNFCLPERDDLFCGFRSCTL
jgi:gamma-glutamyl hercynylcysteine S-oxide synthase